MLAIYMLPGYILVNVFLMVVFVKWLRALIPPFRNKIVTAVICILFLLCASALGIAFILPVGVLQKLLKYEGNIWLGFLCFTGMIYGVVLIITLICVRIHGKRKEVKFRAALKAYHQTVLYKIVGLLTVLAIGGVTVYGVYHAHDIQYNHYEVDINKDGGSRKSLNIALVADLHMGYNVGCDHIRQMVEKINALDPDIILMAGDIFDNEYDALEDPDQLIGILKGLQSKYGTYAVYGNHDIQEKILAGFTFGSEKGKEADPRMDEFMERAGITVLRDESVLIGGSFYLVGRADAMRPGKDITVRATPEELLDDLDHDKPIIVLDHEPEELIEEASCGTDLCLNGHTHDGQIFPANIITELISENGYGYKQFGYMHSIVTSGVGVWGPALRVCTDSEICQITVNFTG